MSEVKRKKREDEEKFGRACVSKQYEKRKEQKERKKERKKRERNNRDHLTHSAS